MIAWEHDVLLSKMGIYTLIIALCPVFAYPIGVSLVCHSPHFSCYVNIVGITFGFPPSTNPRRFEPPASTSNPTLSFRQHLAERREERHLMYAGLENCLYLFPVFSCAVLDE